MEKLSSTSKNGELTGTDNKNEMEVEGTIYAVVARFENLVKASILWGFRRGLVEHQTENKWKIT